MALPNSFAIYQRLPAEETDGVALTWKCRSEGMIILDTVGKKV
jgi:hypothetical protein